MGDKPELPQRFLTAATLHGAVGAGEARFAVAMKLGAKLVDAVNRVAAAVENHPGHPDGEGHSHESVCGECRSPVCVYTGPDENRRKYCAACGRNWGPKE